AGVVTDDGTVVDTARAETPRSAAALERCLDRVVQELCVEHDVKAVGLAVAGFLDPARQQVAFAPHLPWRDAAVPAEMTRRIG
ncbi:ROK family protein, partial [Mycobacterium kansasii]